MDRASGTGDWRVIEEFERDGQYHMSRDEALALAMHEDSSAPNVLRLYSWSPAALSLGYQQPERSVDLEACRVHGIDVVRRPTGGRAVLHKNELTYAVIWRVPFEIGIQRSHDLIVEALIESLSALGGKSLMISDSSATIKDAYRPGELSNAACFLSTSRNEVTFNGRKTIGSAQRRFGNVLLQHGSILLNKEHLLLPDLLDLHAADRDRMRALLERQTADLSEVFDRQIGIEEATNSVRLSFIEHICKSAEEHALAASRKTVQTS
jgi:lipoyl(octanoyl) transferase